MHSECMHTQQPTTSQYYSIDLLLLCYHLCWHVTRGCLAVLHCQKASVVGAAASACQWRPDWPLQGLKSLAVPEPGWSQCTPVGWCHSGCQQACLCWDQRRKPLTCSCSSKHPCFAASACQWRPDWPLQGLKSLAVPEPGWSQCTPVGWCRSAASLPCWDQERKPLRCSCKAGTQGCIPVHCDGNKFCILA